MDSSKTNTSREESLGEVQDQHTRQHNLQIRLTCLQLAVGAAGNTELEGSIVDLAKDFEAYLSQ